MKKKKLSMLLFSFIFLIFLLGNVHAEEYEDIEEKGEVVKVAIPDENGNLLYYYGDEAKKIYEEAQKDTIDLKNFDTEISNNVEKNFLDEFLKELFLYDYKFVKKSSGVTYLKEVRLTNIFRNETSLPQQVKYRVKDKISWSLSTKLESNFYNAFITSVGSDWKKTSSLNVEETINIAPHKVVWMSFKPRVRYISGEVQKYYIPRSPGFTKPVIRERKSLYSTSPRTIRNIIGGHYYNVPDGMYVWKESKAY